MKNLMLFIGLFTFYLYQQQLYIVYAQTTCTASPNTCNFSCINRDECAKKGTGYTWIDDKCPGENCGCCEKVPCVEQSENCPNGKCISRAKCADLGNDYSWNDDKCPGENCGCCEKVPCVSTSENCPNGKCISKALCSEMGAGYTWKDDKCPGENCGCCEKVPCVTTSSTCPNGKCISRDACASMGTGYTWKDDKCPGEDCGCCEPTPCVEQSEKCPDGKCIPKAKCASLGINYSWYDDKCPGENCGCCEPNCFKDEKCTSMPKGKCVASSTACGAGMIFSSTMCRKQGVEASCGCCYSPCVTEDDKCKLKGGKCYPSKEKCPTNYLFTSEYCNTDPTGATKCGCCYPPPEPCKKEDAPCSRKGGKCVPSKEQCQGTGLIFNETLCRTEFANDDTRCGCCYKAPAECKKGDKNCKLKGGVCVDSVEKCKEGYTFDNTTCRTDAATDETKCGCCIPPPKPCLTTDPKCQQLEGKCTTNKENCPIATAGFVFDPSICRTETTGDTTCGCCYKPKCPPTRGCEAKKGKCMNKLIAAEKCVGGSTIDSTLCGGETSTCVCCIPTA